MVPGTSSPDGLLLRSETAMANPPTIAEGATGPTVSWAQYLLVRRTLSYNQIDGIFGAVTKTAVEQFQRDSHLAVDGVVGLQAWAIPVHAGGQVLANLCGVTGPGGG
jgi:peptidoglycan hydrolase-like protein with peptidoglycan-binding domain